MRLHRVVVTADAKLIDALVGKYRLQGVLGMELRHNGSGLTIQADGQPEFEMGYDSAGDFYPLGSRFFKNGPKGIIL